MRSKRYIVCSFLNLLAVFFVSFAPQAYLSAQTGGRTYQFLEITNSARVAALGGDAVAIPDHDADLIHHNPALLNRYLHHHLTLNYVNYFAGAHIGYVAAAARLGRKGTLAGGIHYLNYGKFQGADENGILTGTFRAADYSINITYAYPLDSSFAVGITTKSIYSDFEAYNSSALAFDIGVSFCKPGSRFAAGIAIRNLGFLVDPYYEGSKGNPLPFTIALGISQKLQYAPLTFFVTANHLERWNLTYTTPKEKEELNSDFSDESTEKSSFDHFVDQFMRHIVIGTELSMGKNLTLRGGYYYRRRQEMKIDSKPGMVGFSWGIGIRVSKFRFSYGNAVFHLAGSTHQFSFSMNLDEFQKKF
jgi:hypothetical protein